MKNYLLTIILTFLFGHFLQAQSEHFFWDGHPQKQLDTLKIGKGMFVPNNSINHLITPSLIDSSGSNLRISAAAATTAVSVDPSSTQTGANSLVVFPSPNASTIINKSRESVDLYTGKLNVNVPLFELKSKEITVPIGVSYIGTGGKVDAIGGPLGATFSLEGSGVISRVMKGLPDEFLGSVTPLLYSFKAFGYLNIKNRNSGDISKWATYSIAQKLHLIRMGYWQGSNGTNTGEGFPEAYDTQPDEFYYNFGNGKYSGKFVFDQDGNIHTIPAQNFKISKTIAIIGTIPKIVQFEITTDDGYKYKFGKENLEGVEESQLVTTNLSCKFKFKSVGYYQYDNGARDYLYARAPLLNDLGVNVYDVFSRPDNKNLSIYYYFNSSWYLTELSTPSGDWVNYGYGSVDEVSYIADKSYSVTTPALQEAEYPIDGKSQWVFTTPILPVNSRYPHLQTLTFSVSEVFVKGKRLGIIKAKNGNSAYFDHLTDRNDLVGEKKLDKIRIVIDNKTVKTFTLRYDSTVAAKAEEIIDLTPLRDNDKVLLSTDSDFANQKYTLLPNPKPDVNSYNDKYIKIFAGEHIRYYLKEIKEYGLENKFVGSYLMNYYYPEKLPRRFSPKQDLCGFLNNNTSGTTIPFLMYNPLWFPTYWVPRSGGPLFGWCNLKNKNYELHGSGATLADRSANATLCQTGALKSLIYPIQGAKLFKYELNVLPDGQPTSGLRVKEIITYPSILDTTNFIREKYSYSNPSEPMVRAYSYDFPLTNYENVININSQPYNPQNLTKGGMVGYKEISVSQPNNGKIVYTFLTPKDIPNIKRVVTEVGNIEQEQAGTAPLSEDTDNDWKRGLLKKTYIYDSNNKLIKKSFNDYELNAAGSDVKTIYALLPLVFTDAKINMKRRKASRYTYVSDWLYLKSTTDTTYDQFDNSKYNISTTSYTYNNAYKLLTSVKTTDSENREVLTQYRYPYDFAAATGTNGSMGKLVAKNILSNPIEELAWSDGKLIGGKVRDFDEFSGLLLPKSESVLEINQPISATTPVNTDPANPLTGFNKKLSFISYSKDNLLQYSEEGNLSKSYIWGYNEQFPIAEVVNASEKEIAYTSFENPEELGGWTIAGTSVSYENDGKTGLKSFKGDLKKSNLASAVYKVSLWAKGSGIVYVNNDPRPLNSGWTYCEWEFNLPITEVKILANGNKIDEVRVHPKNAQMTTYNYNYYLGVISVTTPNNSINNYVYDNAGRLYLIKDDKGNIVKRFDYNYQAR